MARDRQRAKQRRDRARRAGNPPARRLDPDTEAPLEEDDPLAHGSAEVDLAHAQVALGRPAEAEVEEEPLPDERGDEDELEEASDLATAAGGNGGRGARRRTALAAADGGGPAAAPSGNRVVGFVRASWRELQRVQWPDRRQVAQATGVVLGFVIIAGAYLGLADALAQKIIKAILG